MKPDGSGKMTGTDDGVDGDDDGFDVDDVLRWSGPLAAVVALGGIVLATLVSPSFRPTGDALSNLGVATTEAGTPSTALLFNGGLVGGAVFGLGFGAWILRERGARVVGGLVVLAMGAMGAIGLFPQGTGPHLPVAATFYVLVTILLWTDGVVAYGGGRRQRGASAATLGTVNLLAWVGWGLTGPFFRPGLAVPEAIGAVAVAAWVVGVSLAGGR